MNVAKAATINLLKTMNLTAKNKDEEFVKRFFLDSLLISFFKAIFSKTFVIVFWTNC